jgi:hypothetical protein
MTTQFLVPFSSPDDAGRWISDAEAAANDSRQQLTGILQIFVVPGTTVAFLVWFHRMHKSLPALGGPSVSSSCHA